MTQITITRRQFERLREIFDMYDSMDQVIWKETHSSGIGPVVTIEFDPNSMLTVDITDLTSW